MKRLMAGTNNVYAVHIRYVYTPDVKGLTQTQFRKTHLRNNVNEEEHSRQFEQKLQLVSIRQWAMAYCQVLHKMSKCVFIVA